MARTLGRWVRWETRRGLERLLAVWVLAALGGFTLVRIGCAVRSWNVLPGGGAALVASFLLGVLADFRVVLCFALPLLCFLLLSDRTLKRAPLRWAGSFALALSSFLLVLDWIAELCFWDEFASRLNFIAVDYLVYTHEILETVEAEIPLRAMLVASFVFLFVMSVLAWRRALREGPACQAETRSPRFVAGTLILLAALWALPASLFENRFSDRYLQELSGNGVDGLVTAFFRNEIPYRDFYQTMPEPMAESTLHAMLDTEGVEPLMRSVHPRGSIRPWNVVIILVESLGRQWLGCFGNGSGLTPHLDALAKESLLFTNCFATGTRTVRGIEALCLSMPPTPGRSIVKRPWRGPIASIGMLGDLGWTRRFIYGGYAYFDCMRDFFQNVGFDVVDRSSLAEDEKRFATVWGVCDEDLMARTLKECDGADARGERFVHFVLTVSNHRPYTYPQVIDLPSGTSGRLGAVKYTDHALGVFFDEAKKRPWYGKTLFVVVADHCASVSGHRAVPPAKYRIPLFFHQPGVILPGRDDRLCGQCDVLPTVLGHIRIDHTAGFVGRDLLASDETRPARVYLGNHQSLGMMERGRLCLLEAKKRHECFQVENDDRLRPLVPEDRVLHERTVAIYQAVSDAYGKGELAGHAQAPRGVD